MERQPVVVERNPVISIDDIELLPGFAIIEHTPRSTILVIPSGFKIQVTRAGPYLYEVLNADDSLKDPGPYTIQIHLMKEVNPPGIIVDHIYEPPRDDAGDIYCPDEGEHPQAYAYFQAWRLHEIKRQERLVALAFRRKDLALLNCVKVISGPMCADEDDWIEPLSEFVDIPESRSGLYLLFLKTQVISTETIRDVIMFLWTVEEVTVEGLKSAFDQFRRSISWSSVVGAVR